MNEQLNTPPGAAEVYSDLSFITLQMVVGTVALRYDLVSHSDFLPQCQAAVMSANSSSGATNEFDVVSISCAFEAYVRKNVFQRAAGSENVPWLPTSSYLPPREVYPLCAPTMDDTGEQRGKTGKAKF
jgi:hypothetical protein